jgi:hypothetical protein
MRTIEVNVFSFAEMNDKAKRRAKADATRAARKAASLAAFASR